MKTTVALAVSTAIALGFSSSVNAGSVTSPYTLSDVDVAMVTEGLAERMRDPDSTRLSNLASARESDDASGDALIWVCGYVSGKNGFGGYGQPVPFMGAIVDKQGGDRSFLVVAISGSDAAEQASVLGTCTSRLR